jgi:hypothetical protein
VKWLLVLLAACGNDPPRTPTKEELQVAIARRVVDNSLTEVRGAIVKMRARKPGPTEADLRVASELDTRAFLDCGLMWGMMNTLSRVADPLMFEIERTCHDELPHALLDTALTIAEGKQHGGVCWVALEELHRAQLLLRDERAPDAIVARIQHACPKLD